MALTPITWATISASIVLLPGVATLVLIRSLRTEDRKLALLQAQDNIDSYSPKALRDLRKWIEANPHDPRAPEARARYNECVRTLREIDEPYYEWAEQQIDALETIDE
jgi:hypothetical protein